MSEHSAAELASLARSAGAPGCRPLIGIIGPPGAGKSTLTAALRAELATWALVEMDGYHLANDVLIALGRRDRKGAPDTFDVGGFVALLRRAREAHDDVVYAPRFRREIEEPIANALPVPGAADGVLVEGNYLLFDTGGWERVAPLLDEVWYVDTPVEVCRERLVARASKTYGSREAGERWVETVDEPNAILIRATRMRADRFVSLRMDQRSPDSSSAPG